jgi:hypothetical protein
MGRFYKPSKGQTITLRRHLVTDFTVMPHFNKHNIAVGVCIEVRFGNIILKV